MSNPRTALVLGATGGIGGEVARRLAARGWSVRGFARRPPAGADGLDWRQGDAMRPAEVAAAAEGAELIVHAVNPPGYRDWDRLVLPMLESTIAAARATGAAILLPGTVYNYGPDAFPLVGEAAPQQPVTRKGAIRVAMEARLRVAAAAGTPVLVVRAGDFFGPRAGNSWFSQGLVKPGSRPRSLTLPGAPGVGHAWAYLPDVAETMVRLVEAGEPRGFASFHMDGHWDPDGQAVAAAIRRVLDEPRLPLRRFPWPLLRLASPLVPLFRELAEMRYLWRTPVRLDNRRLLAALGEEPRTPLDRAVRETLTGLGCLPSPAARAASGEGSSKDFIQVS